MFEKVLSEKLYLEANLDQLQDLVNQKYVKARQKEAQAKAA